MLISPSEPAAKIALPEGAAYLGAERWDLYGVADAELHLFVEADEAKTVERLYWIQFEKYLPSVPRARYDFMTKGHPTVELGDMTFHARARAGLGEGDRPQEGSDAEVMRRILAENGYRLPEETTNVTLKAEVGNDRRAELMIIYLEDLEPHGITMKEIEAAECGGPAWDSLAVDVTANARRRIEVFRP